MFDVAADSYGRFMGRFSEPLAGEFVQLLDVGDGRRALDVGCGPGAVTAMLVERLGTDHVAAVDPSESFVAAARERLPGVDVRVGSAERLPYDDASFDLVVAQLVVHFMADPVAGLREMGRVAAPGARVAASVWDMVSGAGPLDLFWRAARELRPSITAETDLPGVGLGHLAELFAEAGMTDALSTTLTVTVSFPSFADWWDPFTLGVGPAGAHVARLDGKERAALRARCAELAGPPPFDIRASAWCVVADV
jgi:SAM-dependent methyltransferase